jgi:hypothetical protein
VDNSAIWCGKVGIIKYTSVHLCGNTGQFTSKGVTLFCVTQRIPNHTLKFTILLLSIAVIVINIINIGIINDVLLLQEIKEVPYIPKPKPKYQLLSHSSTKTEIREAVIEEFGYNMARIVECESNFKVKALNKFNTNNTKDFGLFQINEVHLPNARKLGIDIHTIEGQFEYTRYLVEKNGTRDWVCARKLGIKML